MASSKSFIATCLRACYAVTLGLLMCVDGVVCKLALITPDWLVAREKREGLALVLSHYAFAAALALSPWIRVVADGDLGPVWADVVGHIRNEADERPLFLVGNHTSFLDTVLTVAKAPIALIYRSRTYVSSHLLSMPVLGTVINAMGLFTVNFRARTADDYSVDKEAMAKMQIRVDAHIKKGGVLCFFPEGSMNADPDTLLPFRYGGMKVALEHDAVVYEYVTVGCPAVWGKKEAVGGWPGAVHYGLKPLAPDGARALVAALKAADGDAWRDKPDHAILAEHLQARMQAYYDELKAKRG